MGIGWCRVVSLPPCELRDCRSAETGDLIHKVAAKDPAAVSETMRVSIGCGAEEDAERLNDEAHSKTTSAVARSSALLTRSTKRAAFARPVSGSSVI